MTRRALVPIALLALALASQAGCANQGLNTEVIVEVDAEPLVQEMARTLVVRVWSGRRNGGIPQTIELVQPLPVFAPTGHWPRTILLTPRTRGDTESFYRFEASAFRETSPDLETDTPIATVRLISGYGRDQTLRVHLLLQDACIGRECGEDETCDRDVCVPARVDDITMLDGGQADASMDASVPGDGGVPGDAGCTPASCNDDNVCTRDACLADGTCSNEPQAGLSCEDELFCNGRSVCNASGVCVSPDVSPCSAPTTCDEALGSCVGCSLPSHCPPAAPEYGPCVPDAGICPTTGMQEGTIAMFTCTAGRCVPAGTTAAPTVSCVYNSDGTSCGGSSTVNSACVEGPLRDCVGTFTATTTRPTCGGGTCTPIPSTTPGLPCSMASGTACDGPAHCVSSCNATGICNVSSCDAGVPEDAGPRDAGVDAGFDAGHDAGFDAGRDAGFDAGRDAGLDAGRDAGVGPPDASIPVAEAGMMMMVSDAAAADELP